MDIRGESVLGQIASMPKITATMGWVTLVAAVLAALILTVEHYTLGKRKMSLPIAIRHGTGLLTILVGVWLWAVMVHWTFPAMMFTLTLCVGSAFMALWYLLDYRADQATQVKELVLSPQDEGSSPHMTSTVHHYRWREWGVQRSLDQASTPEDGKQCAWEIRITPGEEIVVEDGRIVVRKTGHISAM